jgi:hypothetical protein
MGSQAVIIKGEETMEVEVAPMENKVDEAPMENKVEEAPMENKVEEASMENKVEDLVLSSTCEVCICPSVCNRCGVRGDSTIFQCLGCKRAVPQDLRRCELCANVIVPMKYWCKDCSTTIAMGKDGYCFICGRNSSEVEEDEENEEFVPDTMEN